MANPVTPNEPIMEQASLKSSSLRETGFESQVQQFHAGCLNAQTCLDTPFPSQAKIESEAARLKNDKAAMQNWETVFRR